MDIMTVCTIPSKITVDTDNDTNALGLQFTLALKNSFFIFMPPQDAQRSLCFSCVLTSRPVPWTRPKDGRIHTHNNGYHMTTRGLKLSIQ